jgi:hypothetical protein
MAMIRVSTADPTFNQAYLNAFLALPLGDLEQPRQYMQRWREEYKCRIEVDGAEWPHHCYVFDCDEDYTLFMLKWL